MSIVVIAAWYAITSVVAYIAYGRDKAAARAGTRRTPEATLLVLGLIGGWPGALIAQERFRHKTSKLSFRVAFWITVAINVAVLWWLL